MQPRRALSRPFILTLHFALPVSTMFYLAGTYIFRPAEIRRLSERKCLERTSEIGHESGERKREEKEETQERKGKKSEYSEKRDRRANLIE